MVVGYITIACFMLAMSFYLMFRLNHLNKVTDSVTTEDVPSIRICEKLIDTLFEQIRNEKKYNITKDSAFLDIFNIKKKKFLDRVESLEATFPESLTENGEKNTILGKIFYAIQTKLLGHIKSLETSPDKEKAILISQIKEYYDKYISLVSDETTPAENQENIPTGNDWEEEKKQALEQLTESINQLTLNYQTALFNKMEVFQTTVRETTKISLAIIIFAILFGTVFSYFFTRRICYPIKILQDATDRIASGDLDSRITVNSNDEIGNLGNAFNKMCNKLKELDHMKSEFISNISHNIKTPLTAILEANELMLDRVAGQLSESQIKLLNISKENTVRLTMMVNDLLDISRAEAGLMRYNFQHSDIYDVIHKSINDIRFLAENNNIHIQFDTTAYIPKILLDSDKITQVLDNVLSNAIKFTPPGGTITIKAKEVDSSFVSPDIVKQNQPNNVHSFIQISISDTGIGIPVEYHKKIFDKFQQVNNTGKSSIKGTGLGLSIAKHIVIDHGGDIWVENNSSGNGTTFRFVLPAKCDYALNF